MLWFFYEPLITAFAKRRNGVLNTDMAVLRGAWMTRMVGRESRLLDSQILGHALNSASFFASSNLLLDFDLVEKGAQQNAPKYMEWYGGFALLVTLVWLYIELLRLLSKLRSRD